MSCSGTAAAKDAVEDSSDEASLLKATAQAALLSAIPFGIASIGMIVSQPNSQKLIPS